MRHYGCAGCHTIPGVAGADGLAGPPLSSLSQRVYIGGVLPNTPDNLLAWIVDPRAANPRTAMPVTGIADQDARDVAAYLYSVR
jgi:cytochrome c